MKEQCPFCGSDRVVIDSATGYHSCQRCFHLWPALPKESNDKASEPTDLLIDGEGAGGDRRCERS